MKWDKYTIETTNEAADIVASVLFDNNICGAEIDDTLNLTDDELKEMYVDIPVFKTNNGIAKVSFYVSINETMVDKSTKKVISDIADNSYIASNDNIFSSKEFDNILGNIIDELNDYKETFDMGTLKITKTELDDKVFLNKWKENFKCIDIDNISIIPSWEMQNICNEKLNVFIEPGSAFGTGQHATTKLCVQLLNKLIIENKASRFNSFLDIGCGSGILAITAKKLGINHVTAVDIDETIKENLVENICLNFLDRKFSYDKLVNDDDIKECKNYIDFVFGNIIDDYTFRKKVFKDKYDIIVANILAPVIISIVNKVKIKDYLTENGYFICSGIIEEKAIEVENTLKNAGFSHILMKKEENWVSFLAKK